VFTHLTQFSAAKVVIGVTALIVVYFLFTFAGNAIKGHQLNEQEAQLNADIASMQDRYQRLQALEQYLKSDEYVEQVAREQLGLVKPGEIGIVAIPTQPSPTPAPDASNPDLWWEALVR
jgi:cell division protein FtsB